jgi:hypothetical protein
MARWQKLWQIGVLGHHERGPDWCPRKPRSRVYFSKQVPHWMPIALLSERSATGHRVASGCVLGTLSGFVRAGFGCSAVAGSVVEGGVAERPAVSFGGLLRQLRTDAGLTQEELAAAAGLSARSVR